MHGKGGTGIHTCGEQRRRRYHGCFQQAYFHAGADKSTPRRSRGNAHVPTTKGRNTLEELCHDTEKPQPQLQPTSGQDGTDRREGRRTELSEPGTNRAVVNRVLVPLGVCFHHARGRQCSIENAGQILARRGLGPVRVLQVRRAEGRLPQRHSRSNIRLDPCGGLLT